LKRQISIALGLSIVAVNTSLGHIQEPIIPVDQSEFRAIELPSVANTPLPSIIVDSMTREIPTARPETNTPKAKVSVEIKSETKITFSGSPSVKQAQAYALSRLGAAQYRCLYLLWSKESGWDPLKSNYAGSGAYGIPQALPGSKMASAGDDWRTNPITQVKWGIGYVNGRYGSACGAWAFWQEHHWY